VLKVILLYFPGQFLLNCCPEMQLLNQLPYDSVAYIILRVFKYVEFVFEDISSIRIIFRVFKAISRSFRSTFWANIC